MRKEKPMYERERAPSRTASVSNNEEIVICGKCNGTYARQFFGRHKKLCIGESTYVPKALPINLLKGSINEVTHDFKESILSRFRSDTIGQLCCSDTAIIVFGSRLYEKLKRNKDKHAEVKKSVMSDMRRIAALYNVFKSRAIAMPAVVSSQGMLVRKNFSVLTESVAAYTCSETTETKAGLKISLLYLIKKFAKIQKALKLMNDQDDKAGEIDKFLEVLSLNENYIFGDATYILNRNRQTKLRKPEQLPLEEDVEKIREYTVQRISNIVNDSYLIWDLHLYAELRDLAVSRLTLFNGRRGGEPARLLLSEWNDAENGTWLDQSRLEKLSDNEASLFASMKITYQGGKGNNHLVPVLIPTDTCQAMRLLSDPSVRQMSSVHVENIYMFPCTQQSETHVGGWHAVNRVCLAAEVRCPDHLTATAMRHRVSTLYAAMEVSETDRQLFYKHMGHSGAINQHVYQTPGAEAEIVKVGSHLRAMDGRNIGRSFNAAEATATVEATVAVEATVTAEPTVTADSTVTAEPTVTADPTVSAEPTAAREAAAEAEASEKKREPNKQVKEREYHRWGSEDNKEISSYFAQWINGDGFPSKMDILDFLEQHPSMTVTWKKIYTKIFNEKKTMKLRQEKRMKEMQM